jgi:hypothetical protein
MSNIDRQIANVLTHIHREQFGARTISPHCRWYYEGNTDIYHCPHTAVFGKEVISRIPSPYNQGLNPAWEAWQSSPLKDTHPL